ncbi:aldose epimerase family protein [Paracoccus ravus]|uniref:aldose epimerase family protein n=1 Tax=Paracoccus ravus TaxID=2447760 RepID=UPI00106DF854|nr:aldose epimerase family protein [Paracoccus ravus]
MSREDFGIHPDGTPVERLGIAAHGLRASILTLGATLQDLRLDGIDHPMVLGFSTLAPYLDQGRYVGAIVGRCANRIARGHAEIEGQTLSLDRNERGVTTLHGGADGTGLRNWKIGHIAADRLSLRDELPDGHMGFPGAMQVQVDYSILPGPVLQIEIRATSTRTTLCNFAQHSYFNLDGRADIAEHRLTIPAETFLPVDADLIPVGEPAPVAETHLNFRDPVRMGDRLGGPLIDHNLCLAAARADQPEPAAILEAGAVRMRILSTEPGLQVYTADHMRTGAPGLGNAPYGRHAGIALESQLWPDAVHHPTYPSALLKAGDDYRQVTQLGFSLHG